MEGPNFEGAREALAQRVDNLIGAEGSLTFPAVPALVDMFTDKCAAVFAEAGRAFDQSERNHLRSVLARVTVEAYAFSQRSSVTVSYQSLSAQAMNYRVVPNCISIEQAYDAWVATRESPLFGREADARVSALAAEFGDPGAAPVLDIGAGTGRNAVPLARRGHPVDAAELNDTFVDILARAAQRESLNLRAIRRDVFRDDEDLRRDYAMIVLSGVVSEFRTTQQLRTLFDLAARRLAPGGALVANVFVVADGYTPDEADRQFAQLSYSGFFTRDEIAYAVTGLTLELVADDSVYEYEKAHLSAWAWPPTGWYINWVTGRDVYGNKVATPPIESRWLVFRKPGGSAEPA